jgi:3-carboxy-cis,cis-muconate cycloisomerase
MTAALFDDFLSTPEMAGLFAAPSLVQAMLDFEAALAHAEAAAGVLPAGAAEAIAACCDAGVAGPVGAAAGYDLDALLTAGRHAGSLAIPLVKALTAQVAQRDAGAAGWVHWGSTSQDVIDTAQVLVTRRALALIERDLDALIGALQALGERHGAAPMLARTLMQPASVICFGWRVTEWLAPLRRCRARLRATAAQALQVQLGGAVGTLATLGAQGPAVRAHLGALLGLRVPNAAWHTQRDEWVALGCEVGVLCGALGKIARDLALQSQGEIGELAEPAGAGRGGSSAMPHKRNPVAAMTALAAQQRAPQRVAGLLACMAQEQERGLGNWQAELAEWAGLFTATHAALAALAPAAAGLQVDEARMAAHIEALHGLVSAEAVVAWLAPVLGKPVAAPLVEALCRRVVAEQVHLKDLVRATLADDPRVAAHCTAGQFEAGLDAAFDARLAAAPAWQQAKARLERWRADGLPA